MTAIRFGLRRVAKSYAGRRGERVAALAGVDFDILEGRINALTGHSGAGKSTLARIVMGFAAPDSGEVLYRGRPLPETPQRDFRRCNQMVFQNPLLAVNPLLTVDRIIGEPLRVLKDGPPRPDAAAGEGSAGAPGIEGKVREALEHMELPRACLRRRPNELSGGELQRVVLARALVLKPEFLVLDEPFSALDDLTAMKIVLLLKGVFRRLRLGALFISHHPRHLRELADGVAVLENGRLLPAAP